MWNQSGSQPHGCDILQRIAVLSDPDVVVWRGSDVPTVHQGIKILGTPLGHHDFVQNFLERVADEHQQFLDLLSVVPNLQSSWLLLVTVSRGLLKHTTEGCGSVRVVEHPGPPRTVNTGHSHPSFVFGRVGSAKRPPHKPFSLLGELGRQLADDQRGTPSSCRHDHQSWKGTQSLPVCEEPQCVPVTWLVLVDSTRQVGSLAVPVHTPSVSQRILNQAGSVKGGSMRQFLELNWFSGTQC